MRPNPTSTLVAVGALFVSVGFLASCTESVQGGERRAAADPELAIRVLSGQPHLVSGGDALIRIAVPAGTPLSAVTVSMDETDITRAFREDPGRHALLGLVTGLANGNNRIAARAATDGESAARAAHLDLTNYPVTGPMISGPHEQPFHCQSEAFELVTGKLLGSPLDADCSVEPRVDYVYRATDGTFKPLPDTAGSPPADLTQTTTTGGRTVPYIVRVETGTVNRAIYESAILHDPREPAPDPWTRSSGWNGKLIYTHGGGCQSGWYQQGNRTGGVLRDGFLQDGYAVTSASLNVFGQNCNDLLASETHMMVKERFVERYGAPHFTIGTGGSGGSYQSHQTADNYPGVFDGIIVRSSFPDVTSATIFTLADARLLHYYFDEVAPGTFTKEE